MGKNIFSNNSDQVSLLIYTESFLEEDASFLYFNNANKLNIIQVFYMPLLCTPSHDLPVLTGTYRSWCQDNRNFTSIIFPECSGIVSEYYPANPDATDFDNNKLAEKNLLMGNSFSDLFDYIVCSDSWCQRHKDFVAVISFSECKEILRLFLIMKKNFAINANLVCDETLYYIYHHKELFSEFQNFWSACVANGSISDWTVALDNRLLLFSICVDNAKIEAYKVQNNTTAMHLKYHISYLLLLITGTFDNLAWLINNLYGLELERLKIDLLKKEFCQNIKCKSVRIYEILSNDDLISRIEAIRELRDKIVHRDFIQTVSSRGADGNFQNYLWVDKTVNDKMVKAKFPSDGFFIQTKNESALDIVKFINFLTNIAVEIVNDILKTIADEIYQSQHQYIVWKLFNFPEKPYIL